MRDVPLVRDVCFYTGLRFGTPFMDFWKIYRLVSAKRWLLLGLVFIAGAVVFGGTTLQSQRKEFVAEAIMQPQDVSARQNDGEAGGTAPPSLFVLEQERAATVSDLIMLLRSSNDLYVKVARLLRENETDRANDVQRILENNGYFAPIDSDLETQARKLVQTGELTEGGGKDWLTAQKITARARFVSGLTQGRDNQGDFGAGGVPLSDKEIAARIRENMSFDTVAGPLSTDTNPQIVNQIKITARFGREAEANLYTNLLCVAFIDFYTNKSAGASNAQIASLRQKKEEANRLLQKARQDEVTYKKGSQVALTAQQETASATAADLEKQRNDAQQVLQEATGSVATLSALLAAQSRTRTDTFAPDENPQVRALQSRVSDARIAFDKIQSGNLGEAAPEYKSAQTELRAAQAELANARARFYGTTTINQNYDQLQAQLNAAQVRRDGAQQRISVLNTQIVRQNRILSDLPAAQARLADLKREVTLYDRNLSEIDSALSKANLASVSQGRAGTINIVSQSHVLPQSTDGLKQRIKLTIYAMALAFLGGIALVVGMDTLDNSVQTPADVEKLLGLPVAGIIPAQLPDPNRAPRIAHLEPLSPTSEAYRLLRTDLLFTNEEKPFKSLMSATSKPGQGSTTTMSNLAITLAQTGRRVVLVDADMRYPKLHHVFGVSGDVGLSSLLSTPGSLDAALQATEVDNLWLLPAGPPPVNPSELLLSARMKKLHEELKDRADFVVFDTPSMVAFSDGAILAALLDATLLVVRANNVPGSSEDQIQALLAKARANIIGVVLNDVPAARVDSVQYHYNYYPSLPAPSVSQTNGQNPARPHGDGGQAPLALPLSGLSRPEPAAPTAAPTATPQVTASEMQAGESTSTPPFDPYRNINAGGNAGINTSAAPAYPLYRAAQTGVVARPGGAWKTLLLILGVGIALGGLVLALGGSVGVK